MRFHVSLILTGVKLFNLFSYETLNFCELQVKKTTKNAGVSFILVVYQRIYSQNKSIFVFRHFFNDGCIRDVGNCRWLKDLCKFLVNL